MATEKHYYTGRAAFGGAGLGVFWYAWGKVGFLWALAYGFFWPIWIGYRVAELLGVGGQR